MLENIIDAVTSTEVRDLPGVGLAHGQDSAGSVLRRGHREIDQAGVVGIPKSKKMLWRQIKKWPEVLMVYVDWKPTVIVSATVMNHVDRFSALEPRNVLIVRIERRESGYARSHPIVLYDRGWSNAEVACRYRLKRRARESDCSSKLLVGVYRLVEAIKDRGVREEENSQSS